MQVISRAAAKERIASSSDDVVEKPNCKASKGLIRIYPPIDLNFRFGSQIWLEAGT